MAFRDRYELVRRIGSGGAAEVFEAKLHGEGGFARRVAVKRLSIDGDGGSFERGFIDEARIASLLHHANIVAALDFGLDGGRAYLVTELVDGLDLASIREAAIAAGAPVPAEVALFIAAEAARGLEHAHTAVDDAGRPLDIVHRDVSPENLLVSWQGDVKVADFGIAYAVRRLEQTRVGMTKGKLSYMAPEQLLGGTLDHRADIFGLGCTLHFALAGRSAIRDPSDRAIELARELPLDIRAIVLRATQLRAADRHDSAESFAEACDSALYTRIGRDPRSVLRVWLKSLRAAVRESDRAASRPETPSGVQELSSPRAEPPGDRPSLFDPRLVADELIGPESRPATQVAFPTSHFENDGPGFEDEHSTLRTALTDRGEPNEPTSAEAPEEPSPGELNSEVMEGRLLRGYRIGNLVSRGSSARFFLARHVVLDREVGVKLLRTDLLDSEIVRKRFRREAELLARIQSEHVVRVLDFGTMEGGVPFLVMELLRGPALSTIIKSSGTGLGSARAALFTRQIALGLEASHALGVIHRDLKPANVVIVGESEEKAKIVDFGIARDMMSEEARTRLTQTGMLGTPAFMSPEQIRGASKVDARTDLYALGAVLYSMLSGRAPFGGGVAATIASQLRDPPPPLPPSHGLERIAMWLLEKDPDARPARAREVIEAIDALGLVVVETPNRLAPALPVQPDDLRNPSTARPPEPLALPRSTILFAGLGAALVLIALVMIAVLAKPRPAEVVTGSLVGSDSAEDAPTPLAASASPPKIEQQSATANGPVSPSPSSLERSPSVVAPRRSPPSTPVEKARSEPARAPAPAARGVTLALGKLGFRSVEELEAFVELPSASAWRSARSATPELQAQADAKLAAEIESADFDRRGLHRLLERSQVRLESAPEEFEKRYAELGMKLGEPLDRAARRRVLTEIIAFEGALANARTSSTSPSSKGARP
ncbi:MAG: serine/threonine protein kinase [Deltaproteobacteria bacterium]|nr:serine/threonine protein kinase [Deltaproteobacteria bacterium]